MNTADLQTDLNVTIFERLESPAQESSSPWNNAGTGHVPLCELNYTFAGTHTNFRADVYPEVTYVEKRR
jgi:malate dehydrogenase (quinone)